LAREIGISRYQLNRRLKVISGKSPNQVIREFRLQKAFELMQLRAITISEIAYQVGFSSPSYFNACFKKYFGYPPGNVKPSTPAGIIKRYSQSHRVRYVALATGFFAILVVMVFILSPGKDRITGNPLDAKTSISVLPFISLSTDTDDQYLADAMTDEIILQLSYNQDLRVMPGISVEHYMSKERNIRQITRKLDVTYILDGSFQKQGDRVNVYVFLVNARINRIEWKNKYSGNWSDIFTIQNQIAQRIARELDIEMTPDVKRIMEKIPSTSLDAADFYWRGNDELSKFNAQDSGALERAGHLFHEALRLDSTFARAYVGLARVYWTKHHWDTFLSEEFADSALILADKALSLDRQLAEAYVVKGLYYHGINDREQALEEFNRVISLNPSSAEAYIAKGEMYLHDDLLNRIENLHQAALLDRGENLPYIYRLLGWGYGHAGFKEKACNYIKNALELDGDSAAYYEAMSEVEHEFGDFNLAIDFGKNLMP
jgi:TolB-like protein/AraC-like DNA-binding protein